MATTAGSSSSSDVLRSERIAGGILPKVLNSFDMVAISLQSSFLLVTLRSWLAAQALPRMCTGA